MMLSKQQISDAFVQAGVQPGGVVFSHANIAFFGRVEGCATMDQLSDTVIDCFLDVLGPEGTLVLPVFTYSFGSDKTEKVFDLQNSPSTTSGMGMRLLQTGRGQRSADPMLSVIAIGGQAQILTENVDPVCFGTDSFWARFYKQEGLICNLNLDSGSTYLHWIEREIEVPYRQDIAMSGTIINEGTARPADIIYTGRDLQDTGATPKFEFYHQRSVKEGLSRVTPLGRGQIVSQSAQDAKTFLTTQLQRSPHLLTTRHQL